MRNFRTILGLACILGTMGCISLAALGQAPFTVPGQTDFEEFRGRVTAVATVELRPRVSGYVTKVLFKDGASVKQDDVLFELDPRVYIAQFDTARAQVEANEAALKYATATYTRFQDLARVEKGAVSGRELDQYLALRDQATANFELARAHLAVAKLNLDWTKVTSPIDGRIDRALLTAGNHATADITPLATIVSDGPSYVTFEVDQDKHMHLAKLAAGKGDKGSLRVLIGLPSDKDHFPYQGVVDDVGVKVEPGTSKVRWRAVVADLDPAVLPGFAVNVRLLTKK